MKLELPTRSQIRLTLKFGAFVVLPILLAASWWTSTDLNLERVKAFIASSEAVTASVGEIRELNLVRVTYVEAAIGVDGKRKPAYATYRYSVVGESGSKSVSVKLDGGRDAVSGKLSFKKF